MAQGGKGGKYDQRSTSALRNFWLDWWYLYGKQSWHVNKINVQDVKLLPLLKQWEVKNLPKSLSLKAQVDPVNVNYERKRRTLVRLVKNLLVNTFISF